jgi:hypothetical protein
MNRNDGLKFASYAAIGPLVEGGLDAFLSDNFEYGLGHSIACNLGALASGAALFEAILAIDPLCKYFGLEPRTVHWSLRTGFVIVLS